jgi:hypothetical protein
MHEPQSEGGNQPFDCLGGEFGLCLTELLQQLHIDADQTRQASIRNPCHGDGTPQITKKTGSDCGCTNPADAGDRVAAPLILRGQSYVIGSRLDDDRRGGDIDLLVMAAGLSAEQRLRLSLRIAVRFRSVCDEKIDVHVFDPHALTDEERAFLSVVTMRPLAL